MNAESSAKLKALARQGGVAVVSIVPRVALSGLLGALKGLVIMGLIGGALAGASALMWKSFGFAAPNWLLASLALTPVVMALAGGYTGAVRGLLQGLAAQLVERKLLAYV